MKKCIVVLTVIIVTWLAIPVIAGADEYVNGCYRQNGTHVDGYYRTNPDNTKSDNYSTEGNLNPYTGKPGYKRNDSGF